MTVDNQTVYNLLSRCSNFDSNCRRLNIYDHEDNQVVRSIRVLLIQYELEVKTRGIGILLSNDKIKALESSSELLDKLEKKLKLREEAIQLGNEYTVVYELMHKDWVEFNRVCAGQHKGLIKSIEENYRGKAENIEYLHNINNYSYRRVIIEKLDDLNIQLGTSYTEGFIGVLFKLMQYDIYKSEVAENIKAEWDKLLSILGADYISRNDLDFSSTSTSVCFIPFYTLGIDLLRCIRFIGDGDKSHWPYIPITDEILRYGIDFNITSNILNKLKLIGSDTYKGYKLDIVIKLEAIRRGILRSRGDSRYASIR